MASNLDRASPMWPRRSPCRSRVFANTSGCWSALAWCDVPAAAARIRSRCPPHPCATWRGGSPGTSGSGMRASRRNQNEAHRYNRRPRNSRRRRESVRRLDGSAESRRTVVRRGAPGRITAASFPSHALVAWSTRGCLKRPAPLRCAGRRHVTPARSRLDLGPVHARRAFCCATGGERNRPVLTCASHANKLKTCPR